MGATDDPRVVLREAAALMQQGRYAESLQQHLWFHEHALESSPALVGVRLSYALADWVELGKIYPEAMQALVAVRDRKAKALLEGKGSFQVFHDVAAINGFLHQEQETVALFQRLHQSNPTLAQTCYHVAEPYLASHQEYEVCSAYVPDPIARLEKIRHLWQIQLELADENPTLGKAHLRDYAEAKFATEVHRLMVILIGAGRRQEAERVRDLALAVNASTAVQAALDDALAHPDAGP
jgi:hypothetical protein